MVQQESDGLVEVQVVRSHGCDGDVTIRYETRDGSARAGSEYEARAGELAFVSGETMKTIKVLLIDDLIATGGTACAALELIRGVGGEVEEACFVIDLPDLGGADRLRSLGCQSFSLCEFAGH